MFFSSDRGGRGCSTSSLSTSRQRDPAADGRGGRLLLPGRDGRARRRALPGVRGVLRGDVPALRMPAPARGSRPFRPSPRPRSRRSPTSRRSARRSTRTRRRRTRSAGTSRAIGERRVASDGTFLTDLGVSSPTFSATTGSTSSGVQRVSEFSNFVTTYYNMKHRTRGEPPCSISGTSTSATTTGVVSRTRCHGPRARRFSWSDRSTITIECRARSGRWTPRRTT